MKPNNTIFAQTLQDKLERHARNNKLAIVWEDATAQIQCLSYETLREKSLKQAINLQYRYPNGEQNRIGVWLPRTADYVTTFLSIWMAGSVYVPITDTSIQRFTENLDFKSDIEKRVRALAPHLDAIISDAAGIEILQALTSVKLIDIQELLQKNSNTLKPTSRDLQSEAFVYSSSGSTGTPKIIALPFDGVEDRVETVSQELRVTEQDRILNYTGFDFDPSLMEMIQAILFGCPLIMAPEYARIDPRAMGHFYEKLDAVGIAKPTIAIFVPSMLKVMDPKIFVSLKALMTTGENILPKDLMPWFASNEYLRIFTGYGPTEMTWGATLTEISRDPIIIHVSKPMRGIELFVVPTDDAGMHDILISGNGQGYYLGENTEENTKKNWIEHEGRRCFNPHDGIFIEDGKYIYCGRVDDVIKYHGTWINLETIDAVAEKYPGVEFATTVSISGSSLIFVFLLLREDATLSSRDLESHFRSEIGGELFPTFVQINELKYNDRGKRCRRLKDYRDARPLSIPKSSPDPLALVWTQALAEVDIPQIQAAFSAVGIQDFLHYMPDYGPEDRFDEWGGRSLKFTRLITLLWDENIKDPDRSQQPFKHGILRHQSFREMSLFLKLYQAARNSFALNQSQVGNLYPCLWIKIHWDFREEYLEEFCGILEAEIKASYNANFYHIILNCNAESLFFKMKSYFNGKAVIDDCRNISSPKDIDRNYSEYLIKTRLCISPQWEIDGSPAEQLIMDVPHKDRITLLGTACGKTSYLKQLHEQLKRADKVVCYISCKLLIDKPNNLQTFLELSQTEWDLFCQGSNLLAEIHWLIDDIELGVQDGRLRHLQDSLRCFLGKSFVVYSGRENFYPYSLQNPVEYGEIRLLPTTANLEVNQWFQREAMKSRSSHTAFITQLKFILNELFTKKIISAKINSCWWATATLEALETRAELPPLHLTQFQSFSSLVRFLKYHDTMVYSIRPEFQATLEAWQRSGLNYSAASTLTQNTFRSQHSVKDIPSHIKYFPGEAHLSPWIFFHSVSGECPEGYSACAEMIFNQTKQATITISMPSNQQWATLEDQVKSYLECIDQLDFVSPGAPFYLAGWSYGGYCAVEAARQLEKQGRTVAVVMNLDSAPMFADPQFRWKRHREYIIEQIQKSPNATALLQGMECNAMLFEKYCESSNARPLVKVKSYIFQATVQPETLARLAFDGWHIHISSFEIIRCESDHFGIFSNLTFRAQFLKILEHHREEADLRPLRQRLDEKARSFILEQKKLNRTSPTYVEPALESKIYSEFLHNTRSARSLLILGPVGVGKTTCIHSLAFNLMSKPKRDNWYPVVIPLKLYPGVRDFHTILKIYGCSQSDLRQDIRFLFLIDGFEEGDLDLITYPLRISELGKDSKVIIAAQPGIPSLERLPDSYTWELPMLDDKTLVPWLEKYDVSFSRKIQNLLDTRKSYLNWLRAPLFLSMLFKIYQSGQDIDKLGDNLFELYRVLEELLLKENYPSFNFSEAEFLRGYRHYTETLALQETVRSKSPWNYPDSLTQAFKKAGQITEQNGQLRFTHDTAGQYVLATALVTAVKEFKLPKKPRQIPNVLSQIKLNNFPKNEFLVKLLTEYWRHADLKAQLLLRKNLFTIAFLTRRFKSVETVARAASTAMEMQNIFQTSLAGLELSELGLPECDLSGGILGNTRFQNTNLRRGNVTNCNLDGSDFRGADLANVECGELPTLRGNAFCYSPDGEFLVVADEGTIVIYDAYHYQELWRAQVSEEKIRKIIVSSQNLILCCSKHDCVLVNRNTLKASGWTISFDDIIYDIIFSPAGNEIALLFRAWVELESTENFECDTHLSIPAERDEGYEKFERVDGLTPNMEPHAQWLAYSSCSSELAAIIYGKLYIWSTDTRLPIPIQGISDSDVEALLYHPSAKLLFIMTNERIIYSIDILNHAVIREYSIPRKKFYFSGIALHSRQDLIIASEYCFSAGRANASDNAATSKICFPDDIEIAKLSPSGKKIAGTIGDFSNASVYLVDLSSNQIDRRLDSVDSGISDIAYHPKELHFAALTKDDKIHLWPLQIKPCLQQIDPIPGELNSSTTIITLRNCFLFSTPASAFCPHNRRLIPWKFDGVELYKLTIRTDEQEFVYFSIRNGKPTIVVRQINGGFSYLEIAQENISHIRYIPFNTYKIVAANEHNVFIFNILTGHCEQTLQINFKIRDMLISPDGKNIVVCCKHQVFVFDTLTGSCILTLLNSQKDKHRVVRGQNKVVLFEEDLPYTVIIHTSPEFYWTNEISDGGHRVVYHPTKNQFVVTENENIIVVNAADSFPENIIRLRHEGKVRALAYRPDADELAALTFKGEIYFWNMSSYICVDILPLTHHFIYLSYSPLGNYFALWDVESVLSEQKRTPVIQIWHADSRQCMYELSHVHNPRQLRWLQSSINDSQGNQTYYLAFSEGHAEIKVYEIAVQSDATLAVTLIWGSSRHSVSLGRELLQQAPAIEQRHSQSVARLPPPSKTLLLYLRISDYLCYRDYCHFIAALRISPATLQEQGKRPVIDPIAWKKSAPYVGEQLQRLGFFALERAVDIHHLRVNPISNSTSFECDTYQSVMISEENGTVCGDVDIYLLNDLVRFAKIN